MNRKQRYDSGSTKLPASRSAPEPEGPEEISRRFQRMNRPMDLGGLPKRLAGSGKKLLYGALIASEVAAIVLGIFSEVPFMDTLAILLPALLVMFLGDSEQESTSDAPNEEGFFERLLKRFGGPLSDDDSQRPGGG